MVGPSINSRGLPSAERCAWAEAVVTFREAIALNLEERPPRDRINLAIGIVNPTTGGPAGALARCRVEGSSSQPLAAAVAMSGGEAAAKKNTTVANKVDSMTVQPSAKIDNPRGHKPIRGRHGENA